MKKKELISSLIAAITLLIVFLVVLVPAFFIDFTPKDDALEKNYIELRVDEKKIENGCYILVLKGEGKVMEKPVSKDFYNKKDVEDIIFRYNISTNEIEYMYKDSKEE